LSDDNLPTWQTYRRHILRLLSDQISHLHGHHQIEDTHYFPYFGQIFPKLKQGFDLLDNDHHKIHTMLDGLSQLRQELLAIQRCQPEFAKKMHDNICQAGVLLNRHLSDEEDLVIPILGIL